MRTRISGLERRNRGGSAGAGVAAGGTRSLSNGVQADEIVLGVEVVEITMHFFLFDLSGDDALGKFARDLTTAAGTVLRSMAASS